MSVAAGGPSLEDTYRDLSGYVVSMNKAHDWLLNRGIVPNACGLMDPMPVLAGSFTPRKDVTYFVASMCDPSVFDKLRGFHAVLWHASQPDMEIADLIGPDSVQIGGGSTTGLRMLNLGYVCGFREFHFHGLDSSFRGDRHHAYDYLDYEIPGHLDVYGHKTSFALLPQVSDFFRMMERFEKPDIEKTDITLHGTGLLQSLWRQHTERKAA